MRKIFLGCRIGKRLGEDLPLKGKEEIYNCKFSKVNAPRKSEVRSSIVKLRGTLSLS